MIDKEFLNLLHQNISKNLIDMPKVKFDNILFTLQFKCYIFFAALKSQINRKELIEHCKVNLNDFLSEGFVP